MRVDGLDTLGYVAQYLHGRFPFRHGGDGCAALHKGIDPCRMAEGVIPRQYQQGAVMRGDTVEALHRLFGIADIVVMGKHDPFRVGGRPGGVGYIGQRIWLHAVHPLL
ncbi:hypothetical protein SDC9_182009 [bioreactor metagenome]|uniref:Uncharacterized protein n=1 Tax=bioreactor metagenome TaxID=1076179 RepID=A0A645H6A8_9ZZZZ